MDSDRDSHGWSPSSQPLRLDTILPVFPACRQQSTVLPSLCDQVSQPFPINPSVYRCTAYRFCFAGEPHTDYNPRLTNIQAISLLDTRLSLEGGDVPLSPIPPVLRNLIRSVLQPQILLRCPPCAQDCVESFKLLFTLQSLFQGHIFPKAFSGVPVMAMTMVGVVMEQVQCVPCSFCVECPQQPPWPDTVVTNLSLQRRQLKPREVK